MSTQVFLQLAEYKEKHIWQKLGQVLIEDCEWVYNSFETHETRYVICAILCVFLSLIRCLYLYFNNLMKPERSYDYYKIESNTVVNKSDIQVSSIVEHREQLEEEIPFIDNYMSDSKVKTERANNLNDLRKYLYLNNFKLRGRILNRVEHRLDDETLIKYAETGNFDKPLSTTKITFGKGLDELLAKVIPNRVKLKRSKLSASGTCVVFKDDDYGFLSEVLKNLYQENVKITID